MPRQTRAPGQLRAAMSYQLSAAPDQSRSMALWGTALNGARPIGAPIVGVLGQGIGAGATLLLGGLAIFVLCIPLWSWLSGRGIIATLRGHEDDVPEWLVADGDDDQVDLAPTD